MIKLRMNSDFYNDKSIKELLKLQKLRRFIYLIDDETKKLQSGNGYLQCINYSLQFLIFVIKYICYFEALLQWFEFRTNIY